MVNRVGEFSEATKAEAHYRAGYMCEWCGEEPSEEIHHKLAIGVALRHYPSLALEILSSLHNAVALCQECHKLADKEAFKNHTYYALQLLHLQLAQNSDREVERRIRRKQAKHHFARSNGKQHR